MAESKPAAKKTTAAVRAAQHPSTEGAPAAEVDKRSADGADGTRHVKDFVLARPSLGDEDGPEHEPNKLAVLQEAIQRGLHPRGDVHFDGVEDAPDGVSRVFTYSVEVVPAAVDHHAEDTATPRKAIEGGA